MEQNEDVRRRSPEELRMDEEDLREAREKREKKEFEALVREAKRRLRRHLKYFFVLSNDGIVILLALGAWVAFALFRTGIVQWIFSGREGAVRTLWIIAALVALVVGWIIYSLIFRRELEKEARELVSFGGIRKDEVTVDEDDGYLPKPERKRAAEVKMEYPVEVFESLSEIEFDLAEEEWDSLDQTLTEKFFRVPAFLHEFEDKATYSVYVELRYEDTYPNYRLLMKTCDEIKRILSGLPFDSKTQLKEFREKAKEVAREQMAISFPDLKLKEVCIALKQIA